ncbi:MAG: hypothetical protein Q7S22_07250 [Candidatus Micrarchaeota archaeon]|nr:hypothetical protein [Candidatus Micrarchaeota archaeon]
MAVLKDPEIREKKRIRLAEVTPELSQEANDRIHAAQDNAQKRAASFIRDGNDAGIFKLILSKDVFVSQGAFQALDGAFAADPEQITKYIPKLKEITFQNIGEVSVSSALCVAIYYLRTEGPEKLQELFTKAVVDIKPNAVEGFSRVYLQWKDSLPVRMKTALDENPNRFIIFLTDEDKNTSRLASGILVNTVNAGGVEQLLATKLKVLAIKRNDDIAEVAAYAVTMNELNRNGYTSNVESLTKELISDKAQKGMTAAIKYWESSEIGSVWISEHPGYELLLKNSETK